MILNIPKYNQTPSVVNKITTIVERFKQLRTELSTYNDNGIINGYLKKGALYKPLAEKLYRLDKDIKWIVPVIENRRKLYLDQPQDDLDMIEDVTDAVLFNNDNSVSDMYNTIQQYKDGYIEGDDILCV